MSAQVSPDRPISASVARVSLRRSVRARVVFWGALLNALLLLLVLAASFFIARQILWNNAQNRVRQQTDQQAERIGATLRSVAISAGIVNLLAREHPTDTRRLVELLNASVDADPDASGGLIALEPGVADPRGFAYYVGPRGSRDLTGRYLDRAWYRRTRDGKAAWWSEPYLSQNAGNTWVVTYNHPLRSEEGRPLGMISLDVPVSHIQELMKTVLNRNGLRAVLIAPGGTIAVHPVPGVALRTTLDQLIARGREDLRPLATARTRGQPLEFDHLDRTLDERRFTVFTPIDDTGWSVNLSLSHRLVLAELTSATRWLLVGALLALLVSALGQLRLAERLTRPLEQVTESVRHFSQGEYDETVPHLARQDEVGVMARAMESARTSIKRQLGEIEAMGAARQKLESELAIARDIQQAMLPLAPTLTSRGRTLHVYAALEPAKAVGGDFYSFSVRGGRWLWFAIGDVSDKGVPAALFMARAITVLEVAAGLGGSPGDALYTAAQRLVEGNETCMFATVLCGVLDVESGELQLASAGHEPAVLLRADGATQLLDVESGAALGVGTDDIYPVWSGIMRPGDTLLAYTDGITEAFDTGQVAFGMDRLLAALVPGEEPQRICQRLLDAVHRFCEGAAQSDDITVLALCLQVQSTEER
ncbi:SpoIIE family protein phosphatase [Agrilutibacter solisilvae]|uniref:SpoIIE family protein phosphatase n=1 Tax=Agrilutibacter solisilvae TaxID=2763317 RepID=A0A974Y1S0_9GAMM|nr:SpoIIE family protein phosphatase [Lysobacter solisilvae]QSX78948.1 SpoIIE family protein phosphatase [Lysobacter solisilvae]